MNKHLKSKNHIAPGIGLSHKSKKIMKRLLFLAAIMLGLGTYSYSQEKYAVLITGDYAAEDVPVEDRWNREQGNSSSPRDEFWNDTFLMWKMLQEKGYSKENIIVLFAGGEDYSVTNPGIANEYKPEEGVTVTDYSASIANVNLVFNGLAHGTNGFPKVTEDDFLFVWTFDHGGGKTPNEVFIYLIDGIMWDHEFAALTNRIHAHKKVFWMQQCRGGGFYDDLEATNTVFHSACQPAEYARRADDIPIIENEEINNITYHHGEFNFHVYSATVGKSPTSEDNYFGQPYTEADENNDNCISILESYNWEDTHESINFHWINPGEDPLLSDIGNIGAYTSLEYPTLIWDDVVENQIARGIVAITKDVHVTAGSTLTFKSLSKVTFLNNAKLIVDEGANLVIEPGAKFYNGDMEIHMENMPFEISQVYFERTDIYSISKSIKIYDCDFQHCDRVISNNRGGEVKNSNFLGSLLLLRSSAPTGSPGDNIVVTNNQFSKTNNCIPKSMLAIDSYTGFLIDNNIINGSRENGISVMNCGKKGIRTIRISNNLIHDCDMAAIQCYKSVSQIHYNTIFNNQYGIKLLNNSSTSLSGNEDADYEEETQVIRDNDSYEIYASSNAYP